MINPFYQRDLISIGDLSLSDIECIMTTASQLKHKVMTPSIAGNVIAHCFFEPSTRTRLSFEAATLRLGGSVIGFASDDNISTKKGESLHDTVKVIGSYADLVIIRHPKEGAARLAAEATDKPVINAGDGGNQHPTQALIDLFTIQNCQKNMHGLSIALVGDLKYSRSMHSFVQIASLFDVRLFLVSPAHLSLPDYICDELKTKGIRFSYHEAIEEIINKVDIIYLNRIQKERLHAGYQAKNDSPFMLTLPILKQAKSSMRILDPLPRVGTTDPKIDDTPFAYYFEQAANGICIRQALLLLLLNQELPCQR